MPCNHWAHFQRAAPKTARRMFDPDVFGPVDRMDFDSLAQEVQAVDRSQADNLEIDSPDFDSLAIGNPDFETVDRQILAEPAQALSLIHI